MNNDLDLSILDNIEIGNFYDREDKKYKLSKRKKNIYKDDLINVNSEFEHINKNQSSYEDKTKSEKSNNTNKINKDNKTKIQKKTKDSDKSNNINDNMTNKEEKKYLLFMEKYYYHENYKEYEDIKEGIFCMSGKMFNFLYNNKQHKGVENFLDIMIKKTKIFYNMTSIDKRLLVDYFRETSTNIVCTIGQCDSDIDCILSSDIGINLKKPKNINTILCHYYSSNNDIICIKYIIQIGKVFLENNILLEYISFLSTVVLDGYIMCCLLRNIYINKGEITILELEFLILTTFSFFSQPKDNVYFDQNSKVLNIYYIFQLSENLAFKITTVFLFCSLFRGDILIDDKILDPEFVSYFFVLGLGLLISLNICLNFASLYKENPFSNYYLMIAIMIYFIYIIFLILLCSSNYYLDIFNITKFTLIERVVDCYNDKNKFWLLLSIIYDVFGALFFYFIFKVIFAKFIK